MYDEEIEKNILYYIIFEKEQLNVDEEDFFLTKHKQIIKAVQKLIDKKEEVNLISIKNKIEGKDVEIIKYITTIAESRFGSSVEYSYKELKRLSKKRKLIKISNEIKENIEEEREPEIYIEKLIKELNKINEEGEKEKTFLEMLCQTSDIITKKRLQGTKYDYKYFTGIFDLDEATNGLHEEELTIIRCKTTAVGKLLLLCK